MYQGTTTLPLGLGSSNPNVYEEIAFRDKNGISRADYAERERLRKREAEEDRILNDYRGPIPGDVVADVRGLRGARCEWARYRAWLARTQAELAELENTKAKLIAIAEAPAQTENRIVAAIKRTAALLVGNAAADDDTAERVELDNKLAAERHRADAAREALTEVEAQIAAKQLQVETLASRESEFLNPLMRDLLEDSGIPKLLARRRAEVAALESISRDCGRDFPAAYGSERPAHPESCDIEWRHSWRDIAAALRADPRGHVGRLLPTVR